MSNSPHTLRFYPTQADKKYKAKLSALGHSCQTCEDFNPDRQVCAYKQDKKVRAYNICPLHSVTRQDFRNEAYSDMVVPSKTSPEDVPTDFRMSSMSSDSQANAGSVSCPQ